MKGGAASNIIGLIQAIGALCKLKDIQYIEFFAGTGNMYLEMKEVYKSLRFDLLDHEPEFGRTNYMDFASTSGYA